MNTFFILIVVVIFCYFGEKNCPLVLRQNKEILLGVLIGLLICSFMGFKIEGLCESARDCPPNKPYCVPGEGVGSHNYCSINNLPVHADTHISTRTVEPTRLTGNTGGHRLGPTRNPPAAALAGSHGTFGGEH